MKDIILRELKKIEEQENVKIIMAIESGSRAWGFASPDSDYDVRFIYVRKEEDYLKLEKTRDVIEWKLDNVLDINGWDIKKALQLLHNSNPTVFEWCAPPMLFEKLVEEEMEAELVPEVNRLLDMKKTLPEMGKAPRIQVINDYIERELREIKVVAEGIEEQAVEWDGLNALFLRMVYSL